MAVSRIINAVARSAIVLGVGAFAVTECLYTVDPGHRAIVFNRFGGIESKVRGEGAHFRIPILQRPIVMDVRTQPRVITTETGSKDLQNVHLSLRVLARPAHDQLPLIYQKLGEDFLDRVLPSLGNEVLKQVVAQYTQNSCSRNGLWFPPHSATSSSSGAKSSISYSTTSPSRIWSFRKTFRRRLRTSKWLSRWQSARSS